MRLLIAILVILYAMVAGNSFVTACRVIKIIKENNLPNSPIVNTMMIIRATLFWPVTYYKMFTTKEKDL